jgi:peptidoglycan hydrolase CwlO-like protein
MVIVRYPVKDFIMDDETEVVVKAKLFKINECKRSHINIEQKIEALEAEGKLTEDTHKSYLGMIKSYDLQIKQYQKELDEILAPTHKINARKSIYN